MHILLERSRVISIDAVEAALWQLKREALYVKIGICGGDHAAVYRLLSD